MKRAGKSCLYHLVACSLAFACRGCIWPGEDNPKVDLGVKPQASALAKSAAYRDTIGAISYYEGLAPLPVRGYGLVVGLEGKGSSDCPKEIYNRLVRAMYKQQGSGGGVVGVERKSPEELIEDPDTAVVLVRGRIPPAALAGTRFDVVVMALPGTQTKSLRGGRLYPTDLEIFRNISASASISGQVLARVAGPVFLNPFSDEESATRVTSREGVVLGGAVVTKDRDSRLVLTQPSYGWVRKIQNRINDHFPGPRRVANATSPSFVELRVPREFKGSEAHFLALVRGLYLSREPTFEATRARLLGEELVHPAAPHARIALCFEGLGQKALPVLIELYPHPKDYVSFHAAAAGLRLGDHLAGDVMASHASDALCEYRFQAIRALGESKGMAGGAMTLRRLLGDEDPRVQIAAYEALVKRGDTAIQSRPIGRDNFVFDQVSTPGKGFVYAKRSGERRIALFGRDLRCTPPILYRAPDGRITITAQEGDDRLTVLRQVISTGSVSPPIPAPFELADLIPLMGNYAGVDLEGEVIGLGLDYGAVVRTVHQLSSDGATNAQFILEQPNVAELFGPSPPAGRPESE